MMLHCMTAHFVTVRCMKTAHCMTLHCMTQNCELTVHFILLHCMTAHCMTVHCMILHFMTLHCMTLHCIDHRIVWIVNSQRLHCKICRTSFDITVGFLLAGAARSPISHFIYA